MISLERPIPCPKDGPTDVTVNGVSHEKDAHWVVCEKCGLSTKKVWNTGRSRDQVEHSGGGVKEDSRICYKP